MQETLCFDRFELRPAERLLLADGVPVALGARAFDLLLCLLQHRDRLVTREEIITTVWPGLVVEENNLTVQVSALRKVLGAQSVATVPGRGYRFALAVQPAAAAPAAAATVATGPSIAVLPWEARSDDPHLRFLADGLAEDVIALLARVPGFTLISRASSFAFRGHDTAVADIARQLGVRFVVEGSVRQQRDHLRMAVQLTEAASGRMLWSGRFDRPRSEAENLQEDIARGILSELEPELTRAEMAHIRRQRPQDQNVWAHYHQAVGTIALQGWGAQAMAEAQAQLRRSIALDPSFGLAHAHLALLTALSMNIGHPPEGDDPVADALRSAIRAIELDDGSSEVLGYAGCALCDLGQHAQGMEVLERAVAIDPSNAQAHVALGASLVLTGQLLPGIARMRHGMSLSPRDRRLGFWGWALGMFLVRTGELDQALTEIRTAIRHDPRFPQLRVLEAVALDKQGQRDAACAALARACRMDPDLTLPTIARIYGGKVGERLSPIWPAPARSGASSPSAGAPGRPGG